MPQICTNLCRHRFIKEPIVSQQLLSKLVTTKTERLLQCFLLFQTYAPSGNQQVGSPKRNASQRQPRASGPINPSPEQLSKLRSELDIVEGNVRVLSEMLTELQPGQEEPNDYKLLVVRDLVLMIKNSIYLFRINSENTRLMCSVDFIVNFEQTGRQKTNQITENDSLIFFISFKGSID